MKNSRLWILFLLISLLLIIPFVTAQTEEIIDAGKSMLGGILTFISFACDNGGWFFRSLIGQECVQDLSFGVALGLWIILVLLFYDVMATASAFSNLVNFVIAFALVVIFANSGGLEFLTGLIVTAKSSPGSVIMKIAILLFVLIIYILAKTMVIEEKKKKKEDKIKHSEEVVTKMAKAIEESTQ